ncbi:MAG: hypothetical protein WC551_09765 [Patescibacteria group bacterium]
MIISARVINNPIIQRTCEFCDQAIDGPQLRLYGAAEKRDPPFVVYRHLNCPHGDDPKIEKAIEKWLARD